MQTTYALIWSQIGCKTTKYLLVLSIMILMIPFSGIAQNWVPDNDPQWRDSVVSVGSFKQNAKRYGWGIKVKDASIVRAGADWEKVRIKYKISHGENTPRAYYNTNSSSNDDKFTWQDGAELGAAAVGTYVLIKGLVDLFGGSSDDREYYTESNETSDDYSTSYEEDTRETNEDEFLDWWESDESADGGFYPENEEDEDSYFYENKSVTDFEIEITREKARVLDSVINESGMEEMWQEHVEKAEEIWGESNGKTEETRKALAYLLAQQIPGGSIMIEGDKIIHNGVDDWWDGQVEKKNGLFGDCGELKEGSSIWEDDPECYPETDFQKNMKTLLYTIGENFPGASQFINIIEFGMEAEEEALNTPDEEETENTDDTWWEEED